MLHQLSMMGVDKIVQESYELSVVDKIGLHVSLPKTTTRALEYVKL